MVGLRKDLSADEGGELAFHFDLEAFPSPLRATVPLCTRVRKSGTREPRSSSAFE
jgi:hypothetical protein